MRRVGLALAGAVLVAATAVAQAPESPPPGVPAGTATIRGHVIHAERPEAAASVDVTLYALPLNGVPGVRHTRTDASGAYAFEGISNDPHVSYLVGARYRDIPHPGARVVFGVGETERVVDVRIADATDDPRAVQARRVVARVDWMGSRLTVQETVFLDNTGLRTYQVDPAANPSAPAPFSTQLPPGALDFAMPMGIVPEGLVQEAGRISFFGPIYPGEQELSYEFTVPATEDTVELTRWFQRAVDRVEVLIPATEIEVATTSLEAAEDTTANGRKYQRLSAEGVRGGQILELVLKLPEAALRPDAIGVDEARIFVELDEATVRVNEEYSLRVEGNTRVLGSDQSPLLHVPLPAGASGVRFHPDYGVAPHPEGGLAVLGPIAAGPARFDVTYRLPMAEGPIDFPRRFTTPTALLSVFVADTGIVVETERLHRRRPARDKDRTYVHLEAFEVRAGETVEMRLVPLPPRRGLPRAATLAVTGLAALVAFGFLAAPLRAAPAGEAPSLPEESPAGREREAAIEAIRDLDHDFETGKVEEADYRLFRTELRARALELMRAERSAAARPAASPADAPRCAQCGHQAGAGDQFCGQCGGALAAASCPECGRALRAGDRFCSQCGTRLAAPAEGHEARE